MYLFMIYLTKLSVAQTVFRLMIGSLMNWEGYERNRSWSNLGYYPSICMAGPSKTKKNVPCLRAEI
jgi:hypothetical protein